MASGLFTYWIEGKADAREDWRRLKGGEFQVRGDSRALGLFYMAKRRPTFRLWKLRLMCDEGNGLSGQVGSEVTRAKYRKEVQVEEPGAVELRGVDYEAVAKYKSRSAREHVSVSPTAHTDWFHVVRGPAEEVVGVADMMRLSNSLNGQKGITARIKGIYVLKEFRGQGIGTKVIDALEAGAIDDWHATMIEAYAYNREFCEGRGYEAVGTRFNGAVLLRKKWNSSTEAE